MGQMDRREFVVMSGALAGTVLLGGVADGQTAGETSAAFGPSNPFYAASTLPFQAPPFDRIQDTDYQPAVEAGITEHLKEVEAIANNPAPPTFDNTVVALEKSGQLYNRVTQVLDGVAQANSSPTIDKVQAAEAPRRAAHDDAIFLNEKLFQRFATLHKQMDSLGLDAESKRLLDVYYKMFVHQGANLSAEESTLSNEFRTKIQAANKDAAFTTQNKDALAGLSDAQIEAARRLAACKATCWRCRTRRSSRCSSSWRIGRRGRPSLKTRGRGRSGVEQTTRAQS
jgi:peptidyl-dipeptidase Dcp